MKQSSPDVCTEGRTENEAVIERGLEFIRRTPESTSIIAIVILLILLLVIVIIIIIVIKTRKVDYDYD